MNLHCARGRHQMGIIFIFLFCMGGRYDLKILISNSSIEIYKKKSQIIMYRLPTRFDLFPDIIV